jgi:hypothetical protein
MEDLMAKKIIYGVLVGNKIMEFLIKGYIINNSGLIIIKWGLIIINKLG